MSAPENLVVRVMDRANLATERAVLDNRRPDAGFQKARSEPGTGKVILSNTDPDLALVRFGDYLRFDVDGATRFLAFVEHKARAQIAQEEEAGQATEISGRGHLAIVERNIIHPAPSPGIIPFTDTRTFGFASTYLDDSGWGAVETGDLDPGMQPLPEGWVDMTAKKIWVDWPVYDGFAPAGHAYFRLPPFTIAEDGLFRLHDTADDGIDLRIDEVPIHQEERPFLWQKMNVTDVFLAAGVHQVAIDGSNLERPGNEATNLAWVLATLYETTDGGRTLGDVVWHTDDTWVGVAPLEPPGMTWGKVLGILLDEWEARGGPVIARTFSDTLDSAGNAWTVSPDIAARIGDDMLMLLAQGVEAGYGRSRMAPDSITLHAYEGDNTISDTVFTDGVNVTELTHTGSIA